jgi:1,4-alpha-glucan branching enzyme
MLKKKYVKSRNVYKVTFELPVAELPEEVEVERLDLLGDFNQWDPDATPMNYSKHKKAYHAMVELDPGGSYQFRYYLNRAQWLNEWHADGYATNEYGGDNCVVTTPVP